MTTTAAPARTFAGTQERLAASLPGYTRRPAQEALAIAIEQAIADGSIIMAQAGCGTGKSLAALIPAIINAKFNGNRVVVATATKALQEQYADTDLPWLQEHIGFPFKWAKIKGRSNYACAAKVDQLVRKGSATESQQAVIDTLQAPVSGDRDELPTVTGPEWMDLSTSAAECPGKKDCPFGDVCFTERAKAKAAAADIVVTNTAYLIQDLRLKAITRNAVSLLGDYQLLIIDEAHNLPDVATSALSDSIGKNALLRVAASADEFLMQYGREIGIDDSRAVSETASMLWEGLELAFRQWVAEHKPRGNDPVPFRPGSVVRSLHDALDGLLGELADNLLHLCQIAQDAWSDIPEDDKEGLAKGARVVRRLGDWAWRIKDFREAPRTEMVKWMEKEETLSHGKTEMRLYLRSAPVNVGPWLAQNMWGKTPVILMSATLSNGVLGNGQPDFSYLRDTMGLTSPVEFDAGSPFDYTRQARLYVPEKSVPVPSGATTQAWKAYAQEATRFLVTEAGGGALLLFTSRSAMEESYRRLAPVFEAQGLTVMKQGDAPNGILKARFEADIDSVLFGLKSFMEGIDVQGESLRLVVLDKLPFAVPTDLLIQARQEAIEARFGPKQSFPRMTIPTMSLVLIQAFGRAIRHVNDRAVIAVLDSRLTGKYYGQQILNSLPPAPVTTDIREAAAFLSREEVGS